MFSNFNLLTRCWNITRLLLQKRNPKLAQKLKQLGIIDQPLPFFIFDWHYTWFINAFNFELVLRIFDVIILEGFYALFSVADTVFHFLENEILNVQNTNVLQQELKTPLVLLKQPPTVNQFMKYMEKHKIKSSEIDSLLKL
ncbi:Rab GTPase activating protein, putative [Entamoeba histolytica HM-3:IMSS]|nr:Rab GTPase activating protein, putative [Entamoeba histolytica HM-3:IMSS]